MIYGSDVCDYKRADLTDIQTAQQRDTEGSYWKEVLHWKLIDAIRAEFMHRLWFGAPTVRYALGRNDTEMAAVFEVPMLTHWPAGYSPALGVLNFNSGRKRLQFFAGAAFMNGTGPQAIVTRRLDKMIKHTENLTIGHVIADVLDEYEDAAADTADLIKETPFIELSDADSNAILMAAARRNLMPASRIIGVDRHYQAAGAKTVWGLLAAFSAVVRMNPPMLQLEQLAGFQKLLPMPGRVTA